MIAVLILTWSFWTPLSQQRILDGIRLVESGGRESCPDGDGGKSIGPFQIGYAYWLDATAFDPSIGGVYDDCRRRAYAEKVVRAYMKRYVPEAWKNADAEVIARTHNGGPRGSRKPVTREYWCRVREVLASPPENCALALSLARPVASRHDPALPSAAAQ